MILLQIVAVGREVPPEYQLGKRICVENHFYCGYCYQCTHGEPKAYQYCTIPINLIVGHSYTVKINSLPVECLVSLVCNINIVQSSLIC